MNQEAVESHRRYCMSCEKYKPVEGGRFAGSHNQHWRCAECLKKVKPRRRMK